MQNFHSLEFLAETFWCHVHHHTMLGSPGGTVVVLVLPSIDNGANGTKKFLLTTEVSENFAQ